MHYDGYVLPRSFVCPHEIIDIRSPMIFDPFRMRWATRLSAIRVWYIIDAPRLKHILDEACMCGWTSAAHECRVISRAQQAHAMPLILRSRTHFARELQADSIRSRSTVPFTRSSHRRALFVAHRSSLVGRFQRGDSSIMIVLGIVVCVCRMRPSRAAGLPFGSRGHGAKSLGAGEEWLLCNEGPDCR